MNPREHIVILEESVNAFSTVAKPPYTDVSIHRHEDFLPFIYARRSFSMFTEGLYSICPQHLPFSSHAWTLLQRLTFSWFTTTKQLQLNGWIFSVLIPQMTSLRTLHVRFYAALSKSDENFKRDPELHCQTLMTTLLPIEHVKDDFKLSLCHFADEKDADAFAETLHAILRRIEQTSPFVIERSTREEVSHKITRCPVSRDEAPAPMNEYGFFHALQEN